MRKTLIACATFAMIGVGVLLYSCQKTQTPTIQRPVETNAFNVSVESNRLVFASVEDYEKAINNPNEEVMNSFINTTSKLSFTPLIRTRNNLKNLIKCDYLASILNKDLAVQIGDHIYRVNPKTEKVYVLPASRSKEYASLVAEDISNKNISVYSTSEEVLRLVNNNQSSQSTTRCGETGIGGYHPNVAVSAPSAIRAYADYDRYGIYFQLGASIYPTTSGLYEFDFTPGVTQGYILYKPRCRDRFHYPYLGAGSHSGSTQKYTAYSSSRSLNEVYFYYRVKSTVTQTHVSELFGFRVNY